MILKIKTPDNKILEIPVPDGSHLLVGIDADGNDVFDGDHVTSTAGGMEYEARLLPRVVERCMYDKDFDSAVGFRNLVRVDKLPYHKPLLFSATEVHNKKTVIGELQKRDNGVRIFQSSATLNPLENMIKNCYSWYIVNSDGAHQVIFETIKRITNADN